MIADFLNDGTVIVSMSREEFFNQFGNKAQECVLKSESKNWTSFIPSHNLEKTVTDLLVALGIQRHILGFRYLREAIMQAVNDSRYTDDMTKGVYADIAVKFNSQPARAERAMRFAIEQAHAHAEESGELFEEIFPVQYRVTFKRPTCSEFIATTADYLRLKINEAV